MNLQPNTHLYESVAQKLIQLMDEGTFPPGAKLPSVRKLSRDMDVSVSTVVEAYRWLEDRGRIEVRPKSGHFAKLPAPVMQAPKPSAAQLKPTNVQVSDLTLLVLRDAADASMIQLGAGIPSPQLLPIEKLNRAMASVAKRKPIESVTYQFPPGYERLRIEIAKLALDAGCTLNPDDIIITNGCLEAVTLAIRACSKPGDIVAIESPGYYGILQLLELLGLRVLEIPCTYPDGISLPALRFAAEHHPIKMCLINQNINNPLGTTLSPEHKQHLYHIAQEFDFAIIEDDIFTDLHFLERRPHTIKSLDTGDRVLLCSSFSKTLATGYRVGWISPGKYREQVMKLKTVTSMATASVTQMAVAEFLKEGGYNSHVRKIRHTYRTKVDQLMQMIQQHFPEESVTYPPTGGYLLWVQFPAKVDSLILYEDALQHGITIAPGIMFSNKPRYRNYIRLNAAFASPEYEPHIKTLGKLIRKQM